MDGGEDGGECKEGEHVLVFKPNAAVGGGTADEVFGVGAVKVDVALVGVGVLLVQAVEPEDAGEDGIVLFFAVPDGAGEAAFEVGVEGGAFADAFADEEVASGGLV